MCVIIAALSLTILFSLHHEVVGGSNWFSSHHRSYSHIIISIHYTTLHYTILTCINSSGSGNSSGSESCIIVIV